MTPARKQQNVIQFHPKYGKPVSKRDIPVKKNSVVGKLPLWEEVEEFLKRIKAGEGVPFEALEYDINNFPEMKSLKEPTQSFIQGMRTRVKKYEVESKTEVQNRGDRVWLVVV